MYQFSIFVFKVKLKLIFQFFEVQNFIWFSNFVFKEILEFESFKEDSEFVEGQPPLLEGVLHQPEAEARKLLTQKGAAH